MGGGRMIDRRRRQYIPMSVYLASGTTGQRILEKFGLEGLAVWAAYLCACKTNWVQGQLTYAGEEDGLSKLGLYPHRPSFTLKEFFDFTGSLKLTKRLQETRKTSVGRVLDVRCTKWEQWNLEVEREIDASQKSRKRATNTATKPGQNPDDTATKQGTEGEEEDEEETRGRATQKNGSAPRAPDPAKRCDECGSTLGEGHTETCPKMARARQKAAKA